MANKQEPQIPISSYLKNNEQVMDKRAGVGTSFDLGYRKFPVLKTNVSMYYVTGLCETPVIVELMKELLELNHLDKDEDIFEQIHDHLVHQQVEIVETIDDALVEMLSGLVVFFIDGERKALVVDVRTYPGRPPQEPDTEKVVRGSRDGYTENIIENTALTRRRVRDGRLRNEIMRVGERSKTDICLSYIDGVADPGLVKLLKKELENIKIDGLSMADKTVEEFLVHQGRTPFPLVRYTERPDVASAHLLEGHVLVMVDTSPSMIIMPTTYFHHIQHAEEFRQSPITGSFIRWMRFLGILASVFLLPLWLVLVLDPSLLPEQLAFIGPSEESSLPVFVQILIADIGIEFLRIAAIHTPTPLSTAMGLIAAVLIGQIAIDVGLFIPEVILYVAIAAIGTFATPSYELSVANKLCRLLLVLATAMFQVKGLVIGGMLYILLLVATKTLNTPYLWPFIPFNAKALFQVLIRMSIPFTKYRPSVVHPQNNKRQP
ncbi:spore germination protein [Thalassobacillus sp. CUG 92003]|uniref:spore germination protein n=1 Tax=Thalassobacillus sp. CUG 92003 TaxID=2736641 RepID=UPI0015E7C1EB|nr:spore germination protein [Thalassobacillus sp. CUG 92003]